MHGVVRTVEQESGAACNGTEFPDDKPVLIDRIMVKHIIPLKIPWVMDKIIINCKFPYFYIGILNYILQIYNLRISRSGINPAAVWNSPKTIINGSGGL